jgi:hypothetical protein
MAEKDYVATPPATYSPEGRLGAKLRKLECPESNFAAIVSGIVGRARLVEGLTDSRRAFDGDVADKLIEKVVQMEELAAVVHPIPIKWSDTEKVCDALLTRLAAQIESDSKELQTASEWATKRIAQN